MVLLQLDDDPGQHRSWTQERSWELSKPTRFKGLAPPGALFFEAA
jgi:hypothetical protein